jgi:hypothetical protein
MVEIEPQFVKSGRGIFNVYVRGSQRYSSSDPAPAWHIEQIIETAIPSHYQKLSMLYRWFQPTRIALQHTVLCKGI